MKKIIALLMCLVMMFMVTGCGAPEEEQPEEQIDYEIAMVTDAGMIMDGGYSQVAWTTISEFGSQKGVSHKYYKAAEASPTAYKAVIDNAVDKGAKVIIADGYSFEDVVYDAQKKYKDVKFILIDAEPVNQDSGKIKIGENTKTILFASEQAGYLAGYSAVRDGKTELGFMGQAEQPDIMDYGYGFLQGAEAAAQEDGAKVDIKYHYCTKEDTRDSMLKQATEWYENGTEVIFACGSEVEQPVIEAAELTEKKVITSETDKSQMSDTVMTSAVKGIDTALMEALEQYENDEFQGGDVVDYNAENKGIWLEMAKGRFDNFSEKEYDNVFSDIVDGTAVIKKHDSGSIASLRLSNVSVEQE